MRKLEIEIPDNDNSTEKEAKAYLRIESDRLWEKMVETGFVIERQLNQQTKMYPWKGLVIAKWRIEMGDLSLLEDG